MLCFFAEAQYKVFVVHDNNEQSKFLASDSIDVVNKLASKLLKYKNKGFIEASVDSIEFDSNFVFVYIHKGIVYSWKNVEFIYPTELNFKNKKFDNSPVVFSELDLEIEKITNHFSNLGYPFVEIFFDSLLFDENFISTQIIVNPNQYIKYDSIFFNPDVRISSKFLQNYLDFKKAYPYNEKQIILIENKLSELSFIAVNQVYEVEFHSDCSDLYLYMKNKKSNQVSGIVGFTNVDNRFLLTGKVGFTFVNTLKNADIISLKWQKTKLATQDLHFDVEIPYLFSTSIGIGNEFFLEKIDSSYVNVADKLAVSYFFSGFNSVSTFVNAERSIVFDTTMTFSDYSAVLYGISSKLKSLDNIFNPSKGYFVELSMGTGRKLVNDSTSLQLETSIEAEVFLPIFPKLVFHLRGFLYLLNDDYLLENELFKFGGSELMRGFDERSFSANQLFFSSLEIRYLFEKQSNVFLFADYSVFQHHTIEQNFWNHPGGVGVGLNFAAKNNVFHLSYAIGKDDFMPFLLKNAKVHFGVKTIF